MRINHSIARSIRGIAHSKNGLPNQDSVLVHKVNSRQMVAAVADGHGSSNCFRSHLGSQFATEVFVELAKHVPVLINIEEATKYAESIPDALVSGWRKRVDIHLKTFPYANHEIRTVSENDNPYLPYGCTLLGCYIGDRYAIFIQIGDGDLFALFSNGDTKLIVPSDDRLIGNATTSLCLPDAGKDFRSTVIDLEDETEPEIIILATDGLGQSYANDIELFKWSSDLMEIYKEEGGVALIENNLAGWIDDVSSSASADDISVVVIWLGREKLNPAKTKHTLKQSLLNEFRKGIEIISMKFNLPTKH